MLGFRISNRVPADSVGIALLQSPELSVRSTIQTFDFAFKHPDNMVRDNRNPFPISVGVEVRYDEPNDQIVLVGVTSDLSTSHAYITNQAVLKRGASLPRPLFFYYLVGRNIYSLHHKSEFNIQASSVPVLEALEKYNSGQDLTDTERELVRRLYSDIRDEVNLTDRFGRSITDVAYEIGAVYPETLDLQSPYRYQAFNVALILSHKNGPGRTIFIEYNRFNKVIGGPDGRRREVVNAKPIFETDLTAFQEYLNPASELRTNEYITKVKINDLNQLVHRT
jgi:hypothetical protein